MEIIEGGEGGGHLSWVVLLVGMGLNSLGIQVILHAGNKCCRVEVRLIVRLSREGGGWS